MRERAGIVEHAYGAGTSVATIVVGDLDATVMPQLP
jgi:hypothetical protein